QVTRGGGIPMTTDEEGMTMSADFAAALQDLIHAAARFGAAVIAEYRKRNPEECLSLVKLFNAGAGEFITTVQVVPKPRVDVAFVIAGKRHVFFETDARQIGKMDEDVAGVIVSQTKH